MALGKKSNKKSDGMMSKDLGSIFKKKSSPNKKKKGKSRNFISLDIGSSDIKMVSGNYNNDDIEILSFDSIKQERGVCVAGVINNENAVAEYLSTLVRRSRVKEKDVIVSVDTPEIMRREMVIPAMEEKLILSTVRFEISEFLPIDIDKYIIQYSEIDRYVENDTEKLNVMIYAFPEIAARQYFDIVKTAGLNPVALDIQSNCIRKLLYNRSINNYSLRDQTVAIIDIGNESMNLTIIKNGRHEFNRMVRGNVSISSVFVENGICSESSADNIIDRYSNQNLFTNSLAIDELRIQESIISLVDIWIADILKLFQYYTSRSNKNSIDRIFIYGGGSRIKNVDHYIGTRIGIPTNTIESIQGVKFPPSARNRELAKYVNCISAIIEK